jgi:hypothetical protein
MELFRPVGLEELRLVYLSGMRGFPPRLPDQPIFYPVTNEGYAAQIAREWNTTSGTLGGFVTRFEVDDAYAARFERRIVGARQHEELWVPAEELEDFNKHLVGPVRVLAAYFGGDYVGDTRAAGGLAGRDVRAQLVWLDGALARNDDVRAEIAIEHGTVFSSYLFWEANSFPKEGIGVARRDAILEQVRMCWPGPIPLGIAR